MFFWNPLGHRFGAFGFILGCFGSQFGSILEALGRKNEAGNATPTPKGQNPKFAYSYTVFTVIFISKPSQKASRSRQNPLKIHIFCNIHSRSYFFLFLLGFHGKTVILGFLWVPQGAANFHTFGVCFCPGGLWTIRWPKSPPQGPQGDPKALPKRAKSHPRQPSGTHLKWFL